MVPELLVAALLYGLLTKGRYERLLDARVKFVWLIFIPLGLMVLTRVLNYNHIIPFSSPFYCVTRILELVLLCLFSLANTRIPGSKLFLVGLVLNIIVIAANGMMPVSYGALVTVWGKHGLAEGLSTFPFVKQMLIHSTTRLVWLCDVIPLRRPFVFSAGVYSVGDLVSTLGAMIAIVALMRTPSHSEVKQTEGAA